MTDPSDKFVREQPPEMPSEAGPLESYAGARPPAPDWFVEAVSAPYETDYVEVEGARVHYQRWGKRGAPGLLLVHGNGAHAHWWDFIAPYFAERYNVAALTFSGMGDSDRREAYDMGTFSIEQIAVAEAAGLFEADVKPVIVAHSFGGFVTLRTGAEHGARFSGVVIVDSPVNPPDRPHDGPPRRARANRIYPDLKTALARFRLAPPQPCENHYVMDYIARWSLAKTETPEGASGWTWKFDPAIWRRFEAGKEPADMLRATKCRIALMRGEESVLVPDEVEDYMHALLGRQAPFISIPHARHHVMLDQPLAFVSALRTLLGEWDHSDPHREI
ncbi:MAG: alpha/beta hydrolase [Pseudomonadota bacterium]